MTWEIERKKNVVKIRSYTRDESGQAVVSGRSAYQFISGLSCISNDLNRDASKVLDTLMDAVYAESPTFQGT